MTLKSKLKKTSTICLMTLCLSATLSTASAKGKGKGGHRGKPPEAAFTACADQTEAGAACSFDNPNGDTVEGTCKMPRKSEHALVCAPDGGQRGKRD